MSAIRVRAIRLGHYGGLRRQPGGKRAEFNIESEKDFGSWMECVNPADAKALEKRATEVRTKREATDAKLQGG